MPVPFLAAAVLAAQAAAPAEPAPSAGIDLEDAAECAAVHAMLLRMIEASGDLPRETAGPLTARLNLGLAMWSHEVTEAAPNQDAIMTAAREASQRLDTGMPIEAGEGEVQPIVAYLGEKIVACDTRLANAYGDEPHPVIAEIQARQAESELSE